jgi:RimJ/RimL family protein N-acetyltransferase
MRVSLGAEPLLELAYLQSHMVDNCFVDNFEPPPIFPAAQSERFETERLLMRRVIEDDLDPLTPILQDPDVSEMFVRDRPIDPPAFIRDAIAAWKANSSWNFVIAEKSSHRIVGYLGMTLEMRGSGGEGWQAEPAIVISADFRCQRYGEEAMRGLIAWTFAELECPPGVTLDEVRAACRPENTASLRLMEKLADIGMRDLGEQEVPVKNSSPGNRSNMPARVFRITREKYEQ